MLIQIRYLTVVLLSAYTFTASAVVIKEPPESPDPNGRYMFLMFGLQTEILGPDSYNQMYQKKYETTELSKAFSAQGYTVISEIRPRNTLVEDYSSKVSFQVKQLIAKGVKSENIVIAGHSKGAVITLISAGMLSDAKLNFVVMAGCALPTTIKIANENPRKTYEDLIEKYAAKAKGRLLSVYDKEDHEFQTCHEFWKAAPELKLNEKVIDSGSVPKKGHAAFYSPDPKWMDFVSAWLKD